MDGKRSVGSATPSANNCPFCNRCVGPILPGRCLSNSTEWSLSLLCGRRCGWYPRKEAAICVSHVFVEGGLAMCSNSFATIQCSQLHETKTHMPGRIVATMLDVRMQDTVLVGEVDFFALLERTFSFSVLDIHHVLVFGVAFLSRCGFPAQRRHHHHCS